MPTIVAYWLVVLIWSTTPLAIKWGAMDTGFSFAAGSRMLIAVVSSVVVLRLFSIKFPVHKRAIQSYLCAGLGLFGAMYCVYWAALTVDSGLMSVVFGLSPFVTSVLAIFLLKSTGFSCARLIGTVLGVSGLSLVFLSDGFSLDSDMLVGLLALLLGVLVHAGSLVGLKRLSDQSHPLATTAGALTVATPLFILAWALQGAPFPDAMSARAVGSIVYLGTFGSVLGFALYYLILRKMEPSSVAMITVVTPLIALCIGQWLNDEHMPGMVWIGALTISAGLGLHQWGGTKNRRA